MTHTPGPWVAGKISRQIVPINAPGGDPTLGCSKWDGLAHVFGCDDYPDDGAVVARANARLIAAAPELLGVADLVLAHASVETPPELVRAATAALAKARGT